MRVTELELSPAALACLEIAGIHEVDQFAGRRTGELIQRPEFRDGVELYEIACVLSRRGLSLSGHPRHAAAKRRELEMFRLRVIEGLTLEDIGSRFGIKQERVRQLLALHFGMSGIPPAAKRRNAPTPEGDEAQRGMRDQTISGRRRLYLLARVAVTRHYRRPLTLEVVAKALLTSPRQIQRAYAQFGDTSFSEDLHARRMSVAVGLLAKPTIPVSDVARRVGYRSGAHFARAFRSSYGVSPSGFRAELRRTVEEGKAVMSGTAPERAAEVTV